MQPYETRVQTAKAWDSLTKEKVMRGWLIVLGGTLTTSLPVFTIELTDYLLRNDPIDWKTPLALAIGAFSTGVVNTLKEWLKGN